MGLNFCGLLFFLNSTLDIRQASLLLPPPGRGGVYRSLWLLACCRHLGPGSLHEYCLCPRLLSPQMQLLEPVPASHNTLVHFNRSPFPPLWLWVCFPFLKMGISLFWFWICMYIHISFIFLYTTSWIRSLIVWGGPFLSFILHVVHAKRKKCLIITERFFHRV